MKSQAQHKAQQKYYLAHKEEIKERRRIRRSHIAKRSEGIGEMKYIHIYKTDNSYEKREASTKPDLEEMQRIVGGYIEPLRVCHEGHTRTMVVNEDGISLGLHVNHAASRIAGRPIVGDVFILEGYRV